MATLTLVVSPIRDQALSVAKEYALKTDTEFVTEPDPESLYQVCKNHLQDGRSVVATGKLNSAKNRLPLWEIARSLGVSTHALYTYADPTASLVEKGGRLFCPTDLLRQYRHFQLPTYAEPINTIELDHQIQVNEEATQWFSSQSDRLIDNPNHVIRQLEHQGELLRYIPEYKGTIGLAQHNPHHTFEVYEHILKAASFVAGTSLKMVWTLLLHDVGKGFPGIKQFLGVFTKTFASYVRRDRVVIENGEAIRDGLHSGQFYVVGEKEVPSSYIKTDLVGHFYDHENVGAQMALAVLIRLGYPVDFSYEVASLIVHHMNMPRDVSTIESDKLKAWYAKVGRFAPDLMMVRFADNRGK